MRASTVAGDSVQSSSVRSAVGIRESGEARRWRPGKKHPRGRTSADARLSSSSSAPASLRAPGAALALPPHALAFAPSLHPLLRRPRSRPARSGWRSSGEAPRRGDQDHPWTPHTPASAGRVWRAQLPDAFGGRSSGRQRAHQVPWRKAGHICPPAPPPTSPPPVSHCGGASSAGAHVPCRSTSQVPGPRQPSPVALLTCLYPRATRRPFHCALRLPLPFVLRKQYRTRAAARRSENAAPVCL